MKRLINPKSLKELADFRMIEGSKDHPDQKWDKLPREYKNEELREELADAWNYSDGHQNQDLIRHYLNKIYKLI